jgi:hypothetical protein
MPARPNPMREKAIVVATKVAIQMTGRLPIGRVSLCAVINLCMGDLIRGVKVLVLNEVNWVW